MGGASFGNGHFAGGVRSPGLGDAPIAGGLGSGGANPYPATGLGDVPRGAVQQWGG